MYTNELYHHGIKGQKWGVRRYQNANGRLTNAGKKRYSDGNDNSKKSSKSKMSTAKKVAIGAAVVAAAAGITYVAIKAKNNKTVGKGMQAANKVFNNQVDKANQAKKQFEAYNRAINNVPSPESMLNRSRPSVSVPKTSIPKPSVSPPKTSIPKPSVPKANTRSASDSAKLAQERLAAYNRSINNIPGPEDMLNRRRGKKFF